MIDVGTGVHTKLVIKPQRHASVDREVDLPQGKLILFACERTRARIVDLVWSFRKVPQFRR